MRGVIAALALGLLTACSNSDAPQLGLVGEIGAGITQTIRTQTGRGPTETISRPAIEASGVETLLVEIQGWGRTTAMPLVAVNGAKKTYESADGIAITLEGDVLVATRGLGADMMGAEVGQIRSLIGQTGLSERTYEFLDGADRINVFKTPCAVTPVDPEEITFLGRSYQTRKTFELCQAAGGSRITNSYWHDAGGRIIQSEEYVAPGIGYLKISHI